MLMSMDGVRVRHGYPVCGCCRHRKRLSSLILIMLRACPAAVRPDRRLIRFGAIARMQPLASGASRASFSFVPRIRPKMVQRGTSLDRIWGVHARTADEIARLAVPCLLKMPERCLRAAASPMAPSSEYTAVCIRSPAAARRAAAQDCSRLCPSMDAMAVQFDDHKEATPRGHLRVCALPARLRCYVWINASGAIFRGVFSRH
jgi:hypothetical protein